MVLSDKELYPYFFRTVPSDTFQAKVGKPLDQSQHILYPLQAMIEVLIEFGWNYVSVVHTETDYGTTGYAEIKLNVENLKNESILCLAEPLVIHDEDNNYDSVIETLQSNPLTKVVVVFADRKPAGKLLEAAKRKKALDFIWVGSDAWVSRESVVFGREEVVHGAIALQPLRRQLPGFDKYFNQLTEKYLNENQTHPRNPWYKEYYKTFCNCSGDQEMPEDMSMCSFNSKKRPKERFK